MNDTDTQKISTSAGDFFASNIIGIPNGSFINENANSTIIFLNNQSILTVIYEKNLSLENEKNLTIKSIATLPDDASAYLEMVHYWTVNDLRYFTANWTIPKPPRSISRPTVQNDFWNGIMSMNAPGGNRSLIQPVTVWSRNNNWMSYGVYVNTWGKFWYTPVRLQSDVRDIVQGYMYWHDDGQYWDVCIIEYPSTDFVIFSVQSPYLTEDNNEVMCVLETHHISAPSDLPGSTTFYDIKLKDLNWNDIAFNWIPWINTTIYQPELHVLHVNTPSQSRATLFAMGDKIGTFNNGNWNLDYNLDHISDIAFTFGQTGDIPIMGDWDTSGRDGIAYFRPSTGDWHFDYNHNGLEDKSFRYGGVGDQIIKGDWDGDERDGIAIFRPSTGYWYFDYNLDGIVDNSERFGGSTDQIIAGDWQVPGRDGIAIFRPSTGYWYFDNNLDGVIDIQFRYGGVGDRIIKGDWDGDGKDGIAIFRNSTGYWYFDYNLDGVVDKSFRYGGSTDKIMKGDWDGDGKDGIAIYRPSTQYWYFDFNLDGVVDYSFRFGTSSDTPIVGKWY